MPSTLSICGVQLHFAVKLVLKDLPKPIMLHLEDVIVAEERIAIALPLHALLCVPNIAMYVAKILN